MFGSAIILLYCYICSVLASNLTEEANPSGLYFSKRNSSYVRVVDSGELLKLSTDDYVLTLVTAFGDSKKNKTASADDLNKFIDGVLEYYLTRSSEYYYSQQTSAGRVVSITDPICLPNVTVEGTPEIGFYDVKVYGFPLFKPNKNLLSELSPNQYLQDYQGQLIAHSDAVIFAGSFHVYHKSYFFVYTTAKARYQSKKLKARNEAGIVRSKTTEDSFSFLEEQLTHTYDSFLDDYAQVNDCIFPKFVSAMESDYLPELALTADSILTSKFSSYGTEFGAQQRKRILDLLVREVLDFASAKGFDTFHVRPLTFTNNRAAEHNHTAFINYDNITVEGLRNFASHQVSSLPLTVDNSLVHLADRIKFVYPESADKGASLCFTIKLVHKDVHKRFAIKSMVISTAFLANVAKFPPELSRNLEAFELKTGFLVEFEVDLDDDIYYFISKHAGYDLTRAIDTFLYGTRYPDRK